MPKESLTQEQKGQFMMENITFRQLDLQLFADGGAAG
jgi:hypothetical protein